MRELISVSAQPVRSFLKFSCYIQSMNSLEWGQVTYGDSDAQDGLSICCSYVV